MVGDAVCVNFSNVAKGNLAKICLIGLLSVIVPFAGKNAMTSKILESKTKAADPGEQVDEFETGVSRWWKRDIVSERNIQLFDISDDIGHIFLQILVCKRLVILRNRVRVVLPIVGNSGKTIIQVFVDINV